MTTSLEAPLPLQDVLPERTEKRTGKRAGSSPVSYAPRVNILKKVKLDNSWRFAPLKQDANNRIAWNVVLIDGNEEIHKEGTFYIEWYDDGRRKRKSVGKHPHEVLERARRKKLVLESERAGIEVKDHEAADPRRLDPASSTPPLPAISNS